VEHTLRDAIGSLDDSSEAKSAVSFVIEVVSGPESGKRLVITAGRVLIGTSPVCDLVLTDERVSRRHLALSLEGARLRVEDLASTNGTFTNELQITGAYLNGGEKITVGKTLLLVTAAAPGSPDKTPRVVSFGRVLGTSAPMQRVYAMARRIAASDIACTIEGETGTGKEQLAEAIHELSPRARGPFVVFDCTAVPGNLMESALFGHEKGSFTGAAATRHGVFEQADGGTLFIDEIGDLDLALQPKLLRALQRGETQRVGGSGWTKTNVRILAATRRDLDREVQAGRFRDDLFFRLAVARIELPPLRERGGDVELLARSFWASLGPSAGPFPTEFLERYRGHPWPGNVRELLNTVVRWQALGEIGLSEGLAASPGPEEPAAAPTMASTAPDFVARLIRDDVPFSKARQLAALDFERRYVQAVLEKFSGNVTKAAHASGIGRRYFHMLLAKIENKDGSEGKGGP
jgi:transcriptional regulator with GAF, ATPase, and Fis domain